MIVIDRIPTFRGGLLMLSVCFLAACVDRSTIVPAHIDATPRFICPCEPVAVDWSCPRSGEDTFYCDRISVTPTNPAADPHVGPREKSGHRDLPMVCLSTGLTMDIEHEGRSESFGTTVTVINEGTPLTTDHDLQPRCSGAAVVWESLPLKNLNSSCVAITEFCNNNGFDIRVTPEDGSPPVDVPAGCTADFNGPSRNLSVAPVLLPVIPGGACGPERRLGDLPSIEISVTTECNRDLEDCDL